VKWSLPALSSVTAAAFANAAAAAALGVVTARFLGPDGQGALTLVTTIVALVVVTLTLGTGTSLRLRSGGQPTPDDVRAFFGFSFALSPAAGVLTAVVVRVVRPEALDLRALALSVVFGAFALAARQMCDLVQAYGRTGASILSLAMGSLSQAVSFGALVLTSRASLSTALGCAIIGSVVQIGCALFAVRSDNLPRLPNLTVVVWRDLVVVGAPTIGYSLGLLAIQRVDRLLLVALVGTTAGGIYAVAATIAEAARITSSAVGQLLFVRTSVLRRVTADVRLLYNAAIGMQVAVLGVLAVAAPVIVHTFFGPAFSQAVGPLRGLLVAEFFMGIALMDSRIVMGLGHLAEIGAVTVAALVVAISVYALSIRQDGVNGAVIASIVIYAGYAVVLFSRRVHHARDADREIAHV